MQRIFFTGTLVFAAAMAFAQPKADKKLIKQLKKDIGYLASDELEGRRTGSEGERLAADYIIERYKKARIPAYNGSYRQPFTFIWGKEAEPNTVIKIGGTALDKKTAFPMPFSGNGRVESEILPDVMEHDNIWLMPVFQNESDAKDAHHDWEKNVYERCKEALKEGAIGIVLYDEFNSPYPPVFNTHSEYEALTVPVVYIATEQWKKLNEQYAGGLPVMLDVHIKKRERNATNIAAFIDNGAPLTVVLGAHYDHLGHGEDGSSTEMGEAKKDVHNGADDNASGTAALIALGEQLKKSDFKKYNYMLLHFSGEELGLLGSKAFVRESGLDSSKIAAMINMDMVGRLNDSTRALTVGGVGTSPSWASVVNMGRKSFRIAVDSAGVGPSDHTSFYNAGIPVLFFFTGVHKDYHKPSDDAEKINYAGEAEIIRYIYDVVGMLNATPRPAYTVTKQAVVGKTRFKVTLGVMPDYSYQDGDGLRIDGVSEGKAAANAGLKGGDIITELGGVDINGIQTYMEALGKLESGKKTTVKVKRAGKEVEMPIQL